MGYLGTSCKRRVSFAEYAEELQFDSEGSGSPASITEEELLEAQGLLGETGGGATGEMMSVEEATVDGRGSGARRGLSGRWEVEREIIARGRRHSKQTCVPRIFVHSMRYTTMHAMGHCPRTL